MTILKKDPSQCYWVLIAEDPKDKSGNYLTQFREVAQDDAESKLLNYIKTLYGYLDKKEIKQSSSAITALKEVEKLIGAPGKRKLR